MERVADCIIHKLTQEGIGHIFLVTGRGVLFLSDAVARENCMTGISTYHEQGASYAAMAYAQASGGMSACLVSTGCAATNAVTAALCAWQDNVPVIFISGQHMLNETTYHTKVPIRTYGSQEADIVRIVKSITKYAVMISDSDQVAYEMEKAIAIARSGRKGPVWIDIPLDIQNARVNPMRLPHYQKEDQIYHEILHDSCVTDSVVQALSSAERPILLLGGGVRSARAKLLAAEFAERIQIPVVFSPSGADIYGAAHPLSIGAIGTLGGSRAGNFAMQNADYILAVGTRMCSLLTGTDYKNFAPAAKITIVDIDAEEHKKEEVAYQYFIHADAADFFRELLSKDCSVISDVWIKQCVHWKDIFSIPNEKFVQEHIARNEIELYAFAHLLGEQLPHNATVITDAGLEELIIPSAVQYNDGHRCLFPAAQGAMGYAIPAVLGAHFAGRENIVTVVGDGSIMMNVQELYIIAAHGIPAKIFVINNNMYAVIRKRQKDLFRQRTIGNDPSDGLAAPCFSKLADVVDMKYCRISNYEDLQEKISSVLSMEGAVLCEVMCVEDQPYLHKSYALNKNRRLEYRPLEDLSPFMDRDLLAREMIVKASK